VGDFVHALDEIDSMKIFAAAELIGDPFARFAGIVEGYKHGSHGVDAQAVDVVLVEPEEGVGN